MEKKALVLNVPEDDQEIAIKDRTHPESLINMLPSVVAKALEVVPDSLLLEGERSLEEQFNPTVMERQLRLSFWQEYDIAKRLNRTIIIRNVFTGICHQTYFYKKIVGNSVKLAYMMTPPVSYKATLDELVYVGMQQIREVITAPIYNEKGELLPKVADVKGRVLEMLLNRQQGYMIQKVETKNLNVNVDASSSERQYETPEEIDARLRELESQLTKPKDVTPKGD